MPDSRHVLVVDDSTTVGNIVDTMLRQCGFERIDVVAGGPAALDLLRTSRVDIILCDWEMEPMTGLQVLHEVRRRHETRAIPFILMSAKKEPRWVLDATQAGADCLLSKPFDAATLRSKIAQISGMRERELAERGKP